MKSLPDNQIRAILTLLDEDDPQTVDLVKQSLIDGGPEMIGSLRQAGNSANAKVRDQLQGVVDEIQFREVETAIHEWSKTEDEASCLEDGAFLLARLEYPEEMFSRHKQILDSIAGSLAPRLRTIPDLREQIEAVNHHLFYELGFHGNSQNYYDPDNSFLNRVVERRTGIPISLSTLYLAVGERLNLPVSGVGLPGHFMLRFGQEGNEYFLDAFNGGQILSRQECFRFLASSGFEATKESLTPASNREILSRMTRNLIFVYDQLRNDLKVSRLNRLLKAFQKI